MTALHPAVCALLEGAVFRILLIDATDQVWIQDRQSGMIVSVSIGEITPILPAGLPHAVIEAVNPGRSAARYLRMSLRGTGMSRGELRTAARLRQLRITWDSGRQSPGEIVAALAFPPHEFNLSGELQ